MNIDLNSGSSEETFGFGESLGRELEGRELILISGNLGAGKTVFTKGIGSALGIDRREIVSPSYTLMNIYEAKFKLFHIDLYRIGENILGGIPEIDDNLDRGIIVVEWGGFVKKFYSTEKNLINVSISYKAGDIPGRNISLSTEKDILPGSLS